MASLCLQTYPPPPSGQTDIVVSDQFWNPSLYRELAADVYPIETVYATIEVKGMLQKTAKGKNKTTDLDDTLTNISKIRTMAKHKKYVKYTSTEKSPDKPGKMVVHPDIFTMNLAPRSYLFAYWKKGWRNMDAFREDLEKHLRRYPKAHLNGVVLLEKDWFAFQEPHDPDVTVHAFKGNALIRFVNTMLRGIQSIPMAIASIDDYHRAGLFEGVKAGDPQDSSYTGDPEPSDSSYED